MDQRSKALPDLAQCFEIALVLPVLLRVGVARAARSCLCCHTASGVYHPLKTCSLKLTAELRGGPDNTWWGGRGYGSFPCATFFFAPNQKEPVFLSGKETCKFFPPYNLIFLPVLWTNFLCFTVCWINCFLITFCWTNTFSKKKKPTPTPTYHLVGP